MLKAVRGYATSRSKLAVVHAFPQTLCHFFLSHSKRYSGNMPVSGECEEQGNLKLRPNTPLVIVIVISVDWESRFNFAAFPSLPSATPCDTFEVLCNCNKCSLLTRTTLQLRTGLAALDFGLQTSLHYRELGTAFEFPTAASMSRLDPCVDKTANMQPWTQFDT